VGERVTHCEDGTADWRWGGEALVSTTAVEEESGQADAVEAMANKYFSTSTPFPCLIGLVPEASWLAVTSLPQ